MGEIGLQGCDERVEAERPAQLGQGDALVGHRDGAAHAGLDQAAFDADEVGGKQRALVEAGPAEGGALLAPAPPRGR